MALAGEGIAARRAVTTDADGRYEFSGVPAGRYRLDVFKPPYLRREYGQKRPRESGTPIVVEDGRTIEGLDVSLERGSVIAGRVTDEFGQPLVSAQVQAQRYGYSADGRRTLVGAGHGATDDRGQFRMFGLEPGEYFVSAGFSSPGTIGGGAGASDARDVYPLTFYPGTLNPDEAHGISLGVGQETYVDLSLRAGRLSRITGTVADSSGKAAAGMVVTARARANSQWPITNAIDLTAPDGTFALANIPPGEYLVQVRSQPRPDRGVEHGSAPIRVDAGDVSVSITTTRGATISGRLVFEGRSPRDGLPFPVRVLPVPKQDADLPMSFDNASGVVADDGRFTITDAAGELFFVAAAPPGWTLASVMLDGEDLTYVPYDATGKANVSGLRVVLTDRLTKISGQVMDRGGKPVTDYVVVLQPEQPTDPAAASRFFLHAVRPDRDGRFLLEGVPPLRYLATAIESLEEGRQFVPEFRERLRHSARQIEVTEGAAVEVLLELTTGL